jgi:hypothetical protein
MQTTIHVRLLLMALFLAASLPSSAQTRDHLTPQEVDLIKDAQALDLRIGIFIKATDRRLSVLTGTPLNMPPSNSKQSKKDAEKEAEMWGELPKGTRAELLGDVAKIMDEAITNIDDVSIHDEKNPLLPKALRKLAASALQFIDQLTPMRAQAKTEAELGNLEQALGNAQLIIEAARKLPPATAKEQKEKGKGGKPKEQQ